jgi:hypothetical protein
MSRKGFTFVEIDRARRLLGLEERASIQDIKAAYRRLSKRCHPDAGGSGSEGSGRFRELHAAYRLLLSYCEHCRISLARDEMQSFDPEEWWFRRFGENIRPRRKDKEDKDE